MIHLWHIVSAIFFLCLYGTTSVSARWRAPYAVILRNFGEIIFTTAVPMLMPIFCALFPLLCCGRKVKDYKNTQPLIGMPEPLPETSVLANHSSGKFERNDRKKERQSLGLFTIRYGP